jgi:hypothetical protein
MLRDANWPNAVWRFYGFSGNIPRIPKAHHVEQFHNFITSFEEISGEDLSRFRIPHENALPELDFFEGRVIELKRFLNSLKK